MSPRAVKRWIYLEFCDCPRGIVGARRGLRWQDAPCRRQHQHVLGVGVKKQRRARGGGGQQRQALGLYRRCPWPRWLPLVSAAARPRGWGAPDRSADACSTIAAHSREGRHRGAANLTCRAMERWRRPLHEAVGVTGGARETFCGSRASARAASQPATPRAATTCPSKSCDYRFDERLLLR